MNDFTIDTVTLWNMINNNRVTECELKRLRGLLTDKMDEQIKKRTYDSLLQDIDNDMTLWTHLGIGNKIIGANDIVRVAITDINGKTVRGYNLTRTGVIVALGKESSYVKMSVLKHFDSLHKKELEQRAKECQQQEVKQVETPKAEVEKPTETPTETPTRQTVKIEDINISKSKLNDVIGRIVSWEKICECNGWGKKNMSTTTRDKYISALEQYYFVQIHARKGYLLTRKSVEQMEQQKARKTSRNTRKVMATDIDGVYSIKFDSITQAEEYFNIRHSSNITRACQTHKVAYGHYWKYLDEE